MRFKLEITGLKEYQKGLSDLAKNRIPVAVVSALNATVYGAWEAEKREMAASFTGPVPRIVKAPLYKRADMATRSVEVYISARTFPGKAHLSPEDVVRPHVFGGARASKRSELNLRQYHHAAFGYRQFVTPGPGIQRDQYGNIPAKEMKKVMSGAGLLEHGKGYKANITPRSRKRNKKAYGDLFTVPRIGVFKRLGPNTIIPMLYFTRRAPTYRARYKFHEAFAAHVKRNFMKNLLQSWGNVSLRGSYHGR